MSTWVVRWPIWRDRRARDIASPVLLTVVLTAAAYAEAHPRSPKDRVLNGHHVPYTPLAAFLLVAAACLVLVARRRYPIAVLGLSGAAVAAYSLLGYVNGAVMLAPAIALYWVAKAFSVRWTLLISVATLSVLMTATAVNNPFGMTGGGFDLIPALIAAAVFGGIAVRNRNAYVASIQARAEGDALRRVDEERLRIARELHDVVAHTMATINVQAGMAAHVLADQPGVAAEALQTIRAASKDGLRELRAILNVLRQADEGDPTQPTPGLGQLDALLSGAGRAGLPVTVRQFGSPRELPAPVDLTAYRIVQESLTNVIRHAGPATAIVVISYDDAGLRIEVTDTGIGPGPLPLAGGPAGAGGGYGLTGMRERAAAVGGVIQAGPGPAGGFRVTARLPALPQAGGWPAPADTTDPVGEAGPAGGTGPAGDTKATDGTGPAGGTEPADDTKATDDTWPAGDTAEGTKAADETEPADGTGPADDAEPADNPRPATETEPAADGGRR